MGTMRTTNFGALTNIYKRLVHEDISGYCIVRTNVVHRIEAQTMKLNGHAWTFECTGRLIHCWWCIDPRYQHNAVEASFV